MTDKLRRVAVYGSLREGHGNWKHLLNRKPTEVTTMSNFKMYSLGGFPGILPSDDVKDSITVEIYDCDESDMRRLDSLEGYSPDNLEYSMYRRERVEDKDCDVYIWNGRELSEERRVSSGDWTRYLNNRRY